MYKLAYLPGARRYFKKIKDKHLKEAMQAALTEISDNPYIGEEKTGDLSGIYGYDVFYNRTNYEIAYRVYEEEGRLVVVILAGTRENFYDELKRYIK